MIYYLNVCIIGEFYGETMKNVSANGLLVMETLFNNIFSNRIQWTLILMAWTKFEISTLNYNVFTLLFLLFNI